MLTQGYVAGVAAIGLLALVDSVVLARRGGIPGKSSTVVGTIEFAWLIVSGIALFLGLSPAAHWLALGYMTLTGGVAFVSFVTAFILSKRQADTPPVIRFPFPVLLLSAALGCLVFAAAVIQLLMPEWMGNFLEQNDASLIGVESDLVDLGYPAASLVMSAIVVADSLDLRRRNGVIGKLNDAAAALRLGWAAVSAVMLFLDVDPGIYWLAAAQVGAFLAGHVGPFFIVGMVSSQSGNPTPSPTRMPAAGIWLSAAMGIATASFAVLLLLAPSMAGNVVDAGASIPLGEIREALWPIDRTLAIPLSMALAIAVFVKAVVLLHYLARAYGRGLPVTFEGGLLRHMARPTSFIVQIVLMLEIVWLFYAAAHQMFLDHPYAQRQVYWGILYLSLGYFLFRQMGPRFAPSNRLLPFLAAAGDIVAAFAFFSLLTNMASRPGGNFTFALGYGL